MLYMTLLMHVIVIGLKFLGASLLNLPIDVLGAAGGLMVLLPNSRNRSVGGQGLGVV